MSKLGKSLFALACAASMFSCMKEDMLETTPRVSLTFNVTNEESASKAVLNANAVEFQAGEQIGVWDGSDMNRFVTEAGGAHASFSGTAASAASYILVSPYSENYSVNGSVVTYSIPEIQVATPGSADPNALVSMAKVIGTSGEVNLYNCVGLIKVVVPDGLVVKEIQVGGGKGTTVGICGTFTFNTNENTVMSYVDMRTSITLVPQPGQNVIAPGTYYIAVRPNTYGAGLALAYVNADNQLCKRTTEKSVEIARNHILPVGTLNTTNFTPNTGTAVLRTSGDEIQFTGRVKKIAGGSGTATEENTTIEHAVIKAHSLFDGNFNTGNNTVSSNKGNTNIFAYIKGNTLYVCTEASKIQLQAASNTLFRDFTQLKTVTFNNVDTEASTTLEKMFTGCTNLESVDFGDCDFSKVANMQFMFENCPNLKVARFGNTNTTSLQYCKAVFMGCTWMTELNLGPNFTISHISDKSQCNNMFYQTAMDSNSAAGADVSKKCRLYMSQAEYDEARYDQGGVCANSALVPARFWLNPLVPVDPVGPDPTPSTGIKFSIFGDSISTYAGYIQGYTTYYPYGTLNDVSMTYWAKLIAMFEGATLEKNISYSGSCVSYAEETFQTSSTGRSYPLAATKAKCFLTRYAESGIGNPDVLILYGGTNDRVFCKGNVPRPGDQFVEKGQYFYSEDGGKGQYSPASGEVEALCATASADLDLDYFMPAYVELLRRIFNDHDTVKIVCLVGDGMTDAQDAWIKGVTEYFATHGYAGRIKTVSFHNAGNYDGKHYDPNVPKVSGVHPNDAGMTYIANFIYNEINGWI